MGDEEVKQCKNCKKDIAAPNFVVHSAYCFRTVQLCRRCDEPYKRDCLEQHNEDFHATINCSYCDANIEKWTLEKHMTACFRRPISCRFCDITKPFDELSEHITFCGSRTDKCCTCKQFVLLRDLEKHQEICQSRQEGFERYNVTKYKDIVKETSHSTITDTRSESEVGATSKKKEKNFEKNAFLRYKGTNNDASYSFLSDKRIGEFGATSKTVYRRSASCQYCNTEMPLDELSEHKELCGARTEKCSICKQFVILREFEKHKVVCLKHQKHFEKSNFARNKDIVYEDLPTSDEKIGTRASAMAENSSTYIGVCPICKKNIPWIDMNTHVPSCATFNNKCSRCGEKVSSEQLKDHMLRLCPALNHNKSGYAVRISSVDDSSSRSSAPSESNKDRSTAQENTCPYCKTKFPKVSVVDHMMKCCQEYQCSFCLETVPRRNKEVHEKFCPKVMGNHTKKSTQSVAMSSSKTSRNSRIRIGDIASNYMGVCPICKGNIPWVDMNTHVPSCATYNNKCSRCAEEVAPEQLKDHMLKLCPALKGNKSEETMQGKCPYCSKNIPKLRYENHLMYCSQREKKCKFCESVISIADEESHLSNCIGLNPVRDKEESYAATNLTSYNTAVGGYKARERDRKPTAGFGQQTKSSCCSASPCKKDTKVCMFCKDKIPKCEERRHLEVCAFKEHDKSHKIAPANDEWEKRDGKNSGAVSKYSKFSNKVESSLKKCIYCDVYFDAILDPKHMDECIPNLGQCTLCYTVVTIGNFKKHLENDCLKNKDDEKWSKAGSKKKGKNKSNMSSSAPPKGSNIWNFFKKFTADYGMSSGYDATVENTGIYEADRDFSLVYEKSASEIKLPCEFCEELFSMVSLVEHQSGCRPDLVHFPPNHDRQDVRKASDLLATNFLDENSFPADKEFTLPEMKRKLNRNLFSRFETDAAPGSFLEEYNTFEEKNHQYSGKEEYEFNYVANLSSKNSNMKNNTNAVETLPTKNTSISSKNLEIHKPEFSSSLPIPHATGSNFKIEHITEKESHFSLGDCKNDENENIKIKTFSNQNKVIDSDSSDESIDDVKSKKFSSRSEIIDLSSSDENIAEDVKSKKNSNKNETTNLSSSDESIDGENIDAYITYLSKKHEIPDMNDDEIKRDIYHLEESLSAPHKSELVSSIPKIKNSCEAKNNLDHIPGNIDMNADESYDNMLLSDDDDLENRLDKYSAPMEAEMQERDSVKRYLAEINCELRKKRSPEFKAEAFHKWRTAKPTIDSKSCSSSSSSSDTD